MEVKKLFSLGSRAGDPLIVDFKEEKLVAYCKDDFLVFQDYDGAASPVSKIKFSVSPLEIGKSFFNSFFLPILMHSIFQFMMLPMW